MNTIDVRYGLANLTIGRHWLQIKAPWCVRLFSERYGYKRTLFSAFGWRVLYQPKPGTAR